MDQSILLNTQHHQLKTNTHLVHDQSTTAIALRRQSVKPDLVRSCEIPSSMVTVAHAAGTAHTRSDIWQWLQRPQPPMATTRWH